MEILLKEGDGEIKGNEIVITNQVEVGRMNLPDDLVQQLENVEETFEKITKAAEYIEKRNSRIKAINKVNNKNKPFKIVLWYLV